MTVYIGQGLRRIDAFEKVMGTADYVYDMTSPEMLHAKILRSPISHGLILNIDTSRAESLPGVKAVVTAQGGVQSAESYGPAYPGHRFPS